MIKKKDKKFSLLDGREKAEKVARLMNDKKAAGLMLFDLRGISGFTEYMIIASAGSLRQGQALADLVLDYCKQNNFEFLRAEGYQAGKWILLDMNDVVVNIFQNDARELYNLEGLWADAPQLELPAAGAE
ncbi:ribosome silencing factor [Oleidesulfovibrio sp.]|uniref:ribosome silencing factor n=1 Tax=Oleidesulfovibrio sp. TaxID=2909707 RepID=UPI003A8830E1